MVPVFGRGKSTGRQAEDQEVQDEHTDREGQEGEVPVRFIKPPWEFDSGNPVPVRDIFKAFKNHVIKYKSTLLKAFGALFLASGLTTMIPLVTKFAIDFLIPSRNYLLLWATGAVMLLLLVLRSTINTLGGYLLTHTSLVIVFDVRSRLFEHLQRLHLAFYEKEQSGKLVSKLIIDAASLQMLVQNALPMLSQGMFVIIIAFCLMFTINVKLTLFAMMILPAFFLFSYFFMFKLHKTAIKVRERNSIVAGNVNEVITGVKVVKSFGMQEQESRNFVNLIKKNLNYEIDLGTAQITYSNGLELISGVIHACILIVGGSIVMSTRSTMTVGDYVAYLSFVVMMFTPLGQITQLSVIWVNARTGLERILSILNIQPKVVDRPNAKPIEKINGHVKLENVSFEYEPGATILQNINIEARPDETVALVGPSGSGKTTIVSLLTRFYDVTEGKILIDGIDIHNIQLKSYQKHVGIVLQEPFLFSGTIMDNICYGSGRASNALVEEAARQANAFEFINELPNGMATQVGERGQLLSGGQRQRISIARALLKDPDILVLDEATSSLDTRSEKLVQEALERLMRGRTVFIIAHRLSTIRNADKIVVLDKGRVVSQGDHDSLLAKNGLYASLYTQDIKNDTEHQSQNGNGGGQ